MFVGFIMTFFILISPLVYLTEAPIQFLAPKRGLNMRLIWP